MDTIRDRLKHRVTQSTLLSIPVGGLAAAAGGLGLIKTKPHLEITKGGIILAAVGLVYLGWWAWFSRFPCPNCGGELWRRWTVLNHCPSCGISLDTEWPPPPKAAS